MQNYLGSYKTKSTKRYLAGGTSFELPEGSSVKITQVDKEFRKVLVSFGDDTVDWFHYSIVNNFAKE